MSELELWIATNAVKVWEDEISEMNQLKEEICLKDRWIMALKNKNEELESDLCARKADVKNRNEKLELNKKLAQEEEDNLKL